MPPVAAHQPAPVVDLSPRDDSDAEDVMAMSADDALTEAGALEAGAVAAPVSSLSAPMPAPPEPPQVGAEQDAALVNMLRDIQRRWTMIKKVCKQKSSMVSGLLSDAQPIRLDAGSPLSLTVAVKWPFHLEKLREPSKREAVEWALEQVVERPMRVRLVLARAGGSGQPATQQPPRPHSGPLPGPQRPPDAPTPPSRPDTSAPSNIVPFPTTQSGGATGGATGTSSKAQPPQPTQPMRLREAPAAALPDAMLADAPDLSGSYPADVAALEREVRADPVIQELIRIGGTELAEVRALRDDER